MESSFIIVEWSGHFIHSCELRAARVKPLLEISDRVWVKLDSIGKSRSPLDPEYVDELMSYLGVEIWRLIRLICKFTKNRGLLVVAVETIISLVCFYSNILIDRRACHDGLMAYVM